MTGCLAMVVGAAVGAFAGGPGCRDDPPEAPDTGIFSRENLVAWCIVPFDSQGRPPEARAEMLGRLGFRKFAYDWRAEHVASFDDELEALDRAGIELSAFWVAPGVLNDDSRRILDLLKRHDVQTCLWVLLDLGTDHIEGAEQERRVESAASQLGPLARAAAEVGCTIGLYNHEGWFGEPENQLAILEELKTRGIENVGIVYNLHHGHAHLGRLAEVLAMLKPHLVCLNLNGMDPDGESNGRKILPIGQGSEDLEVLRTILASGYDGPIGILGHTMDDAEQRLQDNLDGLDWLVVRLESRPAGPPPTPRTPVPPRPEAVRADADADGAIIGELLAEARTDGDARRGAFVFTSPRFACLTCHKVGGEGGEIGPNLSGIGKQAEADPAAVIASVLWPQRVVDDCYRTIRLALVDGRLVEGYPSASEPGEFAVRDPATGEVSRFVAEDVEASEPGGSLMPEGLAEAMTPPERRDLVRFLLEVGIEGSAGADLDLHEAHAPATFQYDRAPLNPDAWPSWQAPVNRERIYDFYAKEAEAFRSRPEVRLLPPFPGLDGGVAGHWGNQNEAVWADDRWNDADLGRVLSGVFRGDGVTVPKGVCVRLGDDGEVSACFNPETLRFEAAWTGGFLKFSPVRHGFLDGLLMDGTALPKPEGGPPAGEREYLGFYRSGARIAFAYRIDGVEYLDVPWLKAGRFVHEIAPRSEHPDGWIAEGGGPSRWPQVFEVSGRLGAGRPFATDTIPVPFANPWRAPMFFGGFDFLPDGSALVCTMQGDVWRVDGLDESLSNVRWRRVASGLHQALGLVVSDGVPYVLGRDQITRLVDLDDDDVYDFHECVNNAYQTSAAGHDFICGLERGPDGFFYAASGPEGLIRIDPDGRSVETVATGLRNPDGLAVGPDGTITAPNSEGEWVPTSMVMEVRPGDHFGYRGQLAGKPPTLPMAYLPRGIDNSSGGQVFVDDDRLGPLDGHVVHLSSGAGAAFLLLRDEVAGRPQGAVVPIAGEFRSGAHRARINPKDGGLYVAGMAGWGTYTTDDGSFERVRYVGGPTRLPVSWKPHENGVMLRFSDPIDPAVAERAGSHFVQAWNYRYSDAYGSPELSPSHPSLPGHDALAIRSAHVLPDGHSLFLELPDLQPVNTLHLHVRPDSGAPVDIYATVHALADPFVDFPGYVPSSKVIAAHPILADMLALTERPEPNPWRESLPGERPLRIEADKNLTYSLKTLTVRAGEPIRLTFANPDVVPHNWVLARVGSLARVGDLANKLIAEPGAALRQYVPRSEDVLAYTDVVDPGAEFAISFRAPSEPGRYPYLCTFPGHWMVMNGELVVEP